MSILRKFLSPDVALTTHKNKECLEDVKELACPLFIGRLYTLSNDANHGGKDILEGLTPAS